MYMLSNQDFLNIVKESDKIKLKDCSSEIVITKEKVFIPVILSIISSEVSLPVPTILFYTSNSIDEPNKITNIVYKEHVASSFIEDLHEVTETLESILLGSEKLQEVVNKVLERNGLL